MNNMSKNQLKEKVKKLRQSIEDKETISTYSDLFLYEYEHRDMKLNPKLSKKLKQQVQASGFYLNL